MAEKNKGGNKFFEYYLEPTNLRHSIVVKLFISFFALSLIAATAASIILVFAYQVAFNYIPESAAIELIDSVRAKYFVILILVVVPSIILAFLFSRYIVQPIRDITEGMKRISHGDLNVRIPVTRRDEFGNLTRFFNEAVRKLREVHEHHDEISRVKSQFIMVAAHNLNTPASEINWAHETLLNDKSGRLNEEQRAILERSKQANQQIIRIVSNLLNTAHIEEGTFGYSFEKIMVNDFLEKTIDHYSTATFPAIQNDIEVVFEDKTHDLIEIIADSDKLQMALVNVVENAMRYSPPGGKVAVTLERPDLDSLLISIKDEGIGIPEREKNKIFSKFYRASNAIKFKSDGNGLGLFVSKSIIERHGGHIWFESESGKGTTFFVSLPIGKDDLSEFAEAKKVEQFLGDM